MYRVLVPDEFDRKAERFFRKRPELRERFADLVVALQQDPFQPHLRLHHLTGKLTGLSVVRLTYAYRVVVIVVVAEQTITLIDIGSHDEVYR